MTRKLYWEDPERDRFRARVIASGEGPSGPWVELDQTLFYPASGGQPDDRGWIGDAPVLEVERVGGRIRHHLETGEAPAGEVEGLIDRARRRDSMQQHTGQHLLSAACRELLGLETVSSRLGSEECTLDLARADPLSPTELLRLEAWLDEAVAADLPVEVSYHEPGQTPDGLRGTAPGEELAGADGTIRVVSVQGLDRSACGGTHLARTGPVGLVAITGQERAHGLLRIRFVCGTRAIRRLRRDRQALVRAAVQLSCGPPDVPEVLEGRQAEVKGLKQDLKKARRDLLDIRAQHIIPQVHRDLEGRGMHVETWEEADLGEARTFVQRLLAKDPRLLVALACPPGTLILGRGKALTLDLRPLLSEILQGTGGKGGGGPALVQAGGIPEERLQEILRKGAQAMSHHGAPPGADS